MLARDRAPRPFYSRTTKLVKCLGGAAVLPLTALPPELQALAQIPAGGDAWQAAADLAAPRKTAPGRPGRVPRIPREGFRAALATAAASPMARRPS